ncbi:MAG: DMT family transporter [Chthoniobacterales bacterium]
MNATSSWRSSSPFSGARNSNDLTFLILPSSFLLLKQILQRHATYGPWLVGLGAALWGTESAWRIPLNNLFDASVIVWWEHVLILLMFLPILLPRLAELRMIDTRTWGYLLFSGFAGSAVGTIFFTLALKEGNPTVVNVILSVQPVISTLGAFLLFRDRLTPRFFLYAGIAVVAGIFLSVEHPELIGVSFAQAGLNLGTADALVCALFWGLSTVAGRGVMIGMSLKLAASLRIFIGLVCMTTILLFYGKLNLAALWPAAAQANRGTAIVALILLASISGGIPLLIYFEGLRLTRASTAGYFEMLQTLAAVCITWGFFHARLYPHQIIASLVLIAAVVMVQRAQAAADDGKEEAIISNNS